MNWFLLAFQKYAIFSGRARRKEYWFFILFYTCFSLVAFILERQLGWHSPDYVKNNLPHMGFGYLSSLLSLFFLMPSLSVTVRRLHDTDRSGWWWWIGLIPFVGFIVLIVFECQDGTQGPNKYGFDPKRLESSSGVKFPPQPM